MITVGKHVKINFMLNADGEMVHSTKGVPFEYVHGEDKILPGLQRHLEGLNEGDEKTVELDPDEAYGYPDTGAIQEWPIENLPLETAPCIGHTIAVETDNGRRVNGTVAEVHDDTVVMNFNHPLAGKRLTFWIKIMEID